MDRSSTFMSSADWNMVTVPAAGATAEAMKVPRKKQGGGDDGSVTASSAASSASASVSDQRTPSLSVLQPDLGSEAVAVVMGTGKSLYCEMSDCCQRSALWREVANRKRLVCQQHREKGVAYSQLVPICAEKGCFEEVPSFSSTISSSGQRQYCVRHTADRMAAGQARPRHCGAPGCDKVASYGIGGRRGMCREHKREGMTYVVLVCESPRCNKNPSFAPRGETRRRFCKRHAGPGMVNIYYKYCDVGKCPERATFEAGNELRCLAHKEAGMKPRRNICQVPGGGCTRQSSYGRDGGKPVVCTVHREDGMVQVRTKTCKHQGCEKIPSYGYPCMSRDYCKPHALEGMVYSAGKRCRFRGCHAVGVFNYPAVGGGAFCIKHKEDGMINIQPTKCEEIGCKYGASFGDAQQRKKRFCARHKSQGMVNVQNLLAEMTDVPGDMSSASGSSGARQNPATRSDSAMLADTLEAACADSAEQGVRGSTAGTASWQSAIGPSWSNVRSRGTLAEATSPQPPPPSSADRDSVTPVGTSPPAAPAAQGLCLSSQNRTRAHAAAQSCSTRISKRARKQTTTATASAIAGAAHPSAAAMVVPASSLGAGVGVTLQAADASVSRLATFTTTTPQQLEAASSLRISRPTGPGTGGAAFSEPLVSPPRGLQSLANATTAAEIPSGSRDSDDLAHVFDSLKRINRLMSSADIPGPSGCSGHDDRGPQVTDKTSAAAMLSPSPRVVDRITRMKGEFKRAAGFGGVYRSGGADLAGGLRVVSLEAAAAARYVSTIATTSASASSGVSAAQGTSVAVSRHSDSADNGPSGGGDGRQGQEDRRVKSFKQGKDAFLSSLLGMMDPADPTTIRVRGAMMARLSSIATT